MSQSSDYYCIKQGATLSLVISLANADSTPSDLTTMTVSAQIRDQVNVLVDTLTLVTTDTAGQLTAAQDTTNYPLGLLAMDLKVVIDTSGMTLKSETVYFVVEAAITP